VFLVRERLAEFTDTKLVDDAFPAHVAQKLMPLELPRCSVGSEHEARLIELSWGGSFGRYPFDQQYRTEPDLSEMERPILKEHLQLCRETHGYSPDGCLMGLLDDRDWKPTTATPESYRDWEYTPSEPRSFWGSLGIGTRFQI
jgi:hypothetical protein